MYKKVFETDEKQLKSEIKEYLEIEEHDTCCEMIAQHFMSSYGYAIYPKERNYICNLIKSILAG